MASLQVLKRRITAAQNVSKTTKAMQMIAASKLKKAQDAALSARPYIKKLSELTTTLATKIDENKRHPYLVSGKGSGKTLLIILSPDKGLCGGLITNLLREFLSYTKGRTDTLSLTLGKKVEAQVTKLTKEVIASFAFGTTLPTFAMVFPIIRLIDEYYLGKKVESVKILCAEFGSLFTQTPVVSTLLPVFLENPQEEKEQESELLFEPSVDELIPSLLTHYLEMTVYQKLLESFLSEQASRMLAMQNATNNAKDIIEELRLAYNKTRQAKITSEILDISGAAESVSYEH